jgi:hypothetical protein
MQMVMASQFEKTFLPHQAAMQHGSFLLHQPYHLFCKGKAVPVTGREGP